MINRQWGHSGAAIAALLLSVACENSADISDVSSVDADAQETPSAEDLAEATASLPATDIYLAKLSTTDAIAQIDELEGVVMNAGYDNQPWFLPDEPAFLFVSEGESGKTDIWRYDIETGDLTLLSQSEEMSEYSPQLAPDGQHISYIQENPAGDVTEVHKMSPDGVGAAVIDFAPLGYYAWLDGGAALAVFYRSEPGSLYLVDVASGSTRLLHENIGRGLQANADRSGVYFTHPDENGRHSLMIYDLAADQVRSVAALPGGAQDYVVMFGDGGTAHAVFAAHDGVLQMKLLDDAGAEWRSVADLSDLGAISRLAVSGSHQWIAIVAESE